MIATRFAVGACCVLRAPAKGSSGVRRSSWTILTTVILYDYSKLKVVVNSAK
jgi:hypothetical protein